MIVFIQIINNYMITQKYIFFKITKCLQYHGKILPALTRWMSRISFPSPSYSKKFKNFPLVGEILGLFSNRMGDGGGQGERGWGVNESRNQPETQPDPITHGIHQYNHCNHCNHNDNTYQHKPTYWQPTANRPMQSSFLVLLTCHCFLWLQWSSHNPQQHVMKWNENKNNVNNLKNK